MNANSFLEIESFVDEFYEWFTETNDLNNIESVYDIFESINEYLGEEVDFDIDSILEFYKIDDLEELNVDLCVDYDNDVDMDHKIETIDNIIYLAMSE